MARPIGVSMRSGATLVVLLLAGIGLVAGPAHAADVDPPESAARRVTPEPIGPGSMLFPVGLDARTVEAIGKALKYLAKQQSRDGSWRSRGVSGGYPVAMTSLAGLAMLASGSTATQGPFAPNVARAASFLLQASGPNGLIALPEETARPMHGHGFALLFLGELYGTEADEPRQREIKRVLDRGIKLTARAQSKAGGWLYTPDSGGDEGSVTVTQVQGLRACRNAGIAVPKQTIDNALGYLVKSQHKDGGIAYRVGQPGSRPAISAAAVVCWFNAGLYDDPRVVDALAYCKKMIGTDPRARRGIAGHYFYAHLYMAQSMYLSGPEDFNAYFPKIRNALLSSQFDDGSWNGDGVGRVYGTAVALIILQLPYSFLPIMQR